MTSRDIPLVDLTDEPDEVVTQQELVTPNATAWTNVRLDVDLTEELPSEPSTTLSLDQSNNVDISSGKKAHQCTLCAMSFPTKSKLDRHSITHTSDKPFECSLCHRKFTQATNVTRHRRLGICPVISAAHKLVDNYQWTPQLLLSSQNQSSRSTSKRHRRGYYPINKYLRSE